jgi:ketosteroid isomerase-like protein
VSSRRNDKLSRRTILGAAMLSTAGSSQILANPTDGPEKALRDFLHAFENCDLAAMESAFAPDATNFDRTLMSPEINDSIDLREYRRMPGMPPGMRKIAEELPRGKKRPPYQSLKPQDLLIQRSTDIAVCTFHLEHPHALGRRTVVLQRQSAAWKIIHIHASNVEDVKL